MRVSIEVTATLILGPTCRGSIQNTTHDMKTMIATEKKALVFYCAIPWGILFDGPPFHVPGPGTG